MQKIPFILGLLFTSFHLCAQTRVQVISDLEEIDSVVVFNYNGLITTNTKPYQKTIQFEINQSKVDLYNILFMGKFGEKAARAWLDPNATEQKVWINAQNDKLVATRIENSPTNALSERVTAETARLKTANQPDSVRIYLLNTIRQNQGNTYCIQLAQSFVGTSPDTSSLRKLEHLMSLPENNFDWFPLYTPIMANIRGLLNAKPLRMESYSFIDLDSVSQKITLTKGTYTVLDFWFLNCPPCRKDHVQAKADAGQFERAGIPFVGINISGHEELAPTKTYLKEHGYLWPNYFQNGSPSITSELGINGFPTYLVLDDQGVIRFRSHRFQEVKTFLKIP